ncbi:single-strand DNA-binding protein [Streptomyces sp. KhCrAH-43]|uniref:single-stranded DNA-binding protein n=1 Tax=unclassified Streptomyces TaxID=2593676 RepID=UPI000375E648|nr:MULTISPECIES: single-stranded DNA-binding protein [unclassified Streptomyces]MYS34901.1 single-stranded DNA-binding protein [Streptomyces sp. SID4920]MYX65322.1 single-stranded DNA-binding protein [Streptomyces sp. SID8373]RAJ64704.1 single-strand DNA-binding protein [Streptomyces sp. KhCrAH-43]
MAGETTITVVGNLVDDPELRFTPAGAAVAKFRVASTPRVFNKTTNEWEDGEGLFLTCSVWRQQAENAAETLKRGMRVIVQGRLKQRSYEDREGVKRTVYEIDAEEVGPSLLRASAAVTKNPAAGGQHGGGQAADPWAGAKPAGQQPPPQQGGGWGGQQPTAPATAQAAPGYSDEPPF